MHCATRVKKTKITGANIIQDPEEMKCQIYAICILKQNLVSGHNDGDGYDDKTIPDELIVISIITDIS